MSCRPYPNRDRALRQVQRDCTQKTGTVAVGPFAAWQAHLESDEHREAMRRLGLSVSEIFENLSRPRNQSA